MKSKVSKIKKFIYGYASGLGIVPTDKNVKVSNEKEFRAIEAALGNSGTLLFASKSHGHEIATKKKQIFISNANVFVEGGYKAWFGDIVSDTETIDKLKKASTELNKTLYVLREFDGRFLNSPPDDAYLEDKFVFKVSDDVVSYRKI